jgi:hypothetical protein
MVLVGGLPLCLGGSSGLLSLPPPAMATPKAEITNQRGETVKEKKEGVCGQVRPQYTQTPTVGAVAV